MTILVAGASGTAGREVVRLLTARGLPLRVLTRHPSRAAHIAGPLVEVVEGDVRDPRSLTVAVDGVETVVSLITGFGGIDAKGAAAIDGAGNRNLIAAAAAGSPRRFVLVSIAGAAPDHPLELYRAKFGAEEALRRTSLDWTILRPRPFIETILGIVARPIVETGRTRLIGRGDNPVNLVSARDVARFVELAVLDPALAGRTIEIPGPENLTLDDVIRATEAATGRVAAVSRAPVAMMRLVSLALRVVNPVAAGQVGAAVLMATAPMAADPSERMRLYPGIVPTTLAEVLRRDLLAAGP